MLYTVTSPRIKTVCGTLTELRNHRPIGRKNCPPITAHEERTYYPGASALHHLTCADALYRKEYQLPLVSHANKQSAVWIVMDK